MTIMLNKYIIKYKFNNNRVLINALNNNGFNKLNRSNSSMLNV